MVLASMVPHSIDDRARRALTFRTVKGGVTVPAHQQSNGQLSGLGDVSEIRKLYETYGAPLTKTARRNLARIARRHGESVRSLSTLALVR